MRIIGVIGGLGPMATADYFVKIINNTKAKTDQDHLPIVIYNNPQIPDRTDAILEGGKSPVAAIVETGKKLIDIGVDFLCIPCNTSFYFYEQIQEKLSIPILNMIDITVEYLKTNGYKRVIVLGTRATIKTGIYANKIKEAGIELIETDNKLIDMLNFMIYKVVKANNYDHNIQYFLDELDSIKEKWGVEAFILGCTELPILFEKYNIKHKSIDPTELLALEAIRLARQE